MNQSAVPVVSPATLEIVALGGLGEFGMNMMAVSWEDTTVLIDAGVMFPDPDQLGVDLIIPDLTFVEARRAQVKGLALIEPKLEEHGIDARDRLKTVKPRDAITVGPFTIEFIRVTHSMPDCVAL